MSFYRALAALAAHSASLLIAPALAADPDRDEPLEVVVSMPRTQPHAAPKSRMVAASVTRASELRAPGTSAAEVLRDSPGVQVTQLGGFGAPATASLRGATAAQTPVYLAGIRLNDEVGGAANLADVPLSLVDRIEVYRSHAPLTADRQGIGGAIFFEPRAPRGDEFAADVGLGSWGTRWLGGRVASAGADQAVLAAFDRSASNNDYPFSDDRGTLFRSGDDRTSRLSNADAAATNFWLLGRRSLDSGQLQVLFNHTSREQGAPKLALLPSQRARAEFVRSLAAVRTLLPIEPWAGSVELSSSAIEQTTTLRDPLSELGLLALGTENHGTRFSEQATLRQTTSSGIALQQYVAWSIERLGRRALTAAGPYEELVARRFEARVGAGVDIPLAEHWLTSASLALECVGSSTSGAASCAPEPPSGRLGLSYQRGSFEAFFNIGSYHRSVTLSELYGASLLVRGNAKLEPERGETAELGARWSASHAGRRYLWADAAVFARRSRDLVNYVRTAQGYLHPMNRDRVRTLGGELALGASPASALETRVVTSVLDPRDTSPERTAHNDVLAFTSRLTVSAEASVNQAPELRWLDRAQLTYRIHYQSSRYADRAGLAVLPEQHWSDLELVCEWLGGSLRGRGRVHNVFDQRRFDVVGFPLPGRSAFIAMEAEW